MATAMRIRAFGGGLGAAVLGAAPHVLHHAGPLAGAALVAGVTGQILFGALALALAMPMLNRVRKRTGTWRVPAALLAVMTAAFMFSTLVVGPALTDDEDENLQAKPADHEVHHR